MAAQSRSPYSYEEIDTEALPRERRFGVWRETRRLPMQPEATNEEGRRQFRVGVRRLSGPPGRFLDVRATPMKLTRTTGHCHRDTLDMISVTLMLNTGVSHQFDTGKRQLIVYPGQILLKDFTRPAGAVWLASVHRGLNLHLPRLTVDHAIGNAIARLHGLVLNTDGLAQLLKAQLTALADTVPRLSDEARIAALDATIAMAATVLRVEFGTRLEAEENSSGLFAAAVAFIDRHLESHRLGPEAIAKQLGCSRAHLYRIFAANGAAIADYIREARLQRTRDMLAADDGCAKRIGDIAFSCGFEDPVYFARLFRGRFGMTPREFRASGSTASPQVQPA